MVTCIVPIVEGHGEREAVGELIRRIAAEVVPDRFVRVEQPIRRPRSSLLRPGQIERDVDFAARRAGLGGGVLVLIDSDGDPPCIRGPELLARAKAARPDVPVGLVLAHREYEAWFLASAVSLRGERGLPPDLMPPPDPESVRGAKEWLSRHMPRQQPYKETLDQPALTARFDLAIARNAGSFDKCYREVERLLKAGSPRSDT